MDKKQLLNELAEARARLDYAVRRNCPELINISGLEIAQIGRHLALIQYKELSEEPAEELMQEAA